MAASGDSASSKVIALHAQVITPASDALFQAESTLPATRDEWQKLAARAGELVRAATVLESIPSAKDQREWLQFARALRAGAEQAARAATAADQDALVNANGQIVSACEDCHAQYRDAGRSMKQ
jgi:cytochrome c556